MEKLVILFLIILASGSVAGLNLSEANVVDVELDGDRFSVTMIHDDSGEDGYANWWQVETMEGDLIGRRELLHSHGTRNFTRSKSIETEEDKVVVRAHDQKHGYGGQAIVFDTSQGVQKKVRQGIDRQEIKANEQNQSVPEQEDSPEPETNQDRNDQVNNSGTSENLLSTVLDFLFKWFK